MENDAEGIDIVAGGGHTIETLGSHIGDRPHLMASSRQRRAGRGARDRSDAKVDEADVELAVIFLLVKQDITGLEIAVDDATFMDIGDGLHQGRKELVNLHEWHG